MRRVPIVDLNAAAGRTKLRWTKHAPSQPDKSRDLLRLDDALTRLCELDPRKSHVIELRFFGGLSVDETAAVLEISDRTVLREWNLARAWLYREISAKQERGV